MGKKKSELSKLSGKIWRDPDDAPEITDALLDGAVLMEGDKIVRRGRPKLDAPAKSPVTIRLDTDLLESYRATGTGWQSRINADLRRVRKLPKARKQAKAS